MKKSCKIIVFQIQRLYASRSVHFLLEIGRAYYFGPSSPILFTTDFGVPFGANSPNQEGG